MAENILTKEQFLEDYKKEIELKKQQESLIKEEIQENNTDKFYNRGGKIKVNYESEGNFSIPETLYYTDYTAKDVNDLTMCTPEDQIETAVAVLNTKVFSQEPVKIEDMTLEEFFETLVAMKIGYKSPIYDFEWYCVDCQGEEENPEPKIKKIDLNKLKYKSISQVNEEIQMELAQVLNQISEEDYNNILLAKGYNSFIDREDFVKNIKVQEPIIIPYAGNKYHFRFPRVKDLIIAKRLVEKNYSSKIKRAKNEIIPGKNPAEASFEKEEKIKKIQNEKYKSVLLYLKAMTYIGYNDVVIKDDNERISAFSKLSQEIVDKLEEYLKKTQYGINEEIECTCEICGKTTRRWLQQELDFTKLFPIKAASTPEFTRSTLQDIYFGV